MKKSIILGTALFLSVLAVFTGESSQAKSVIKKTKNYKYTVEKGNISIIKYIGKKNSVSIPEKIKGKTVVSVQGFSHTRVSSVVIPKSVVSIEPMAFQNCKNLKKVKLSKQVKKIPDYAFMGCDSLQKISLSKQVTLVGAGAFENCKNLETVGDLKLSGIGSSAFKNCEKLADKIMLDSTLAEIPEYSFYNCKKLTFEIAEKSWKIGAFAFANCPKITVKYIGSSVSESAYAGCRNISKVECEDENVIEQDGLYYNKDKTILVYVRPDYNGTFDFLKQITSIGAYAFSGIAKDTIVIPDNIKEIQEGAFYGAKCKSIQWNKNVTTIATNMFAESACEKVGIPEGVTTVEQNALKNMPKCTSVSIPASVVNWDYDSESSGVLEGFTALKKVEVAKENKIFKSGKGMLFSKNGSRLLCYPAGKKAGTYCIPKTVTLGMHAFSAVKNLKVVFPSGTSNSIAGGFVNCKNVTVVLPKKGISFPSKEHELDFPMFTDCTNCKAVVVKNSYVHKKLKALVKKGTLYERAYAYKVR